MTTFPFAAVLFDLDGTLADTVGDLSEAMNHALGLQGLPPHDEVAYRSMVGQGVENLARRALPPGNSEKLPRLVADFRERYAAHMADRTRPYPGVAELLRRLSIQGQKLAVLSNKREEFTRGLVELLFPSVRFDAVRGERPGAPRKPDPSAALEIARELGVIPERCALVGDTAVDMQTANRAGMFAVGVLWGFRTREELLASGAQALLARPLDLLEVSGAAFKPEGSSA